MIKSGKKFSPKLEKGNRGRYYIDKGWVSSRLGVSPLLYFHLSSSPYLLLPIK